MRLSLFEKIRVFIIGFLVWALYRTLSLTWKIREEVPQTLIENLRSKRAVIFAHWHGDELALAPLLKRYRVATIVSQSKDGQIMEAVLRRFGAQTSRGSSTRGGVSALLGLLRLIRDHQLNCSFAVDGPKGPRHQVKPGVFEVSRLLKQAPIYSAGVSCSRAWHFPKAWNKTYLPKPFAHIVVQWGDALTVEPSTDPRSPEVAQSLSYALRQAQESAQNLRLASLDAPFHR